jgi:hypothetical protein
MSQERQIIQPSIPPQSFAIPKRSLSSEHNGSYTTYLYTANTPSPGHPTEATPLRTAGELSMPSLLVLFHNALHLEIEPTIVATDMLLTAIIVLVLLPATLLRGRRTATMNTQ